MLYIKSIDGLRAIAVSLVIVFHFFPTVIPNGYLGVDLFFVISGFLISKIIHKKILEERFLFKDFYLSRVRRILPATLAVLVTTSIMALLLMTAPDLMRYAESLLSSIGFSANIYFWRTGGYFGFNDTLKPLLHIWSLSVEEQFYFLFPLFFYCLYKYSRSKSLIYFIFSIVILLSFFLNIYLLSIGGSNPAFFLTPARAWQFACGAMFATFQLSRQPQIYSRALSLIGITLVLVNFIYVPVTFPDATLLTIGACIFLCQSHLKTLLINKILSLNSMRFVGKISFSLYLWHWPVVVFVNYVWLDTPSTFILLLSLLFTLILSTLSWRYIEEPLRQASSSKKTYMIVISSSSCLILFSSIALYYKGFPERHSDMVNKLSENIGTHYRCSIDQYRSYNGTRACAFGEDVSKEFTVALVGNSHAQMYAPAFEKSLTSSNKRGLLIPLSGCLPTINYNISPECLNLAQRNYHSVLEDKKIKTVILALTWHFDHLVDQAGYNFIDSDFSLRKRELKLLIDSFNKKGKNVYLLGPLDIPGYEFASKASRSLMFYGTSLKRSREVEEFYAKYGDIIDYFLRNMGGNYILPHKYFCDKSNCYFADENGSFYSDSNHLSSLGVKKLIDIFDPIISDNTKEKK